MARDRTHTAHVFNRLVSEGEGGLCVFVCSSNPHCVEHEVRRRQERSPFAIKREQRRDNAGARRRP